MASPATLPSTSYDSSRSTPSSMLSPGPPPSLRLDSTSPSSPAPRPTSVIINNVRGAEGGVDAITARRRNSGSFQHMSSGGLVSNSPFMQRLNGGAGGSPTKTQPPSSPLKGIGLYVGDSRIPTLANASMRRTSGSRKASGEGPVKENSNPSLVELAAEGYLSINKVEGSDSPSLSRRSPSPSVPFKPTRNNSTPSPALSSTSALTSSADPSLSVTTGAPFKPSRPTFGSRAASSQDDDLPRRQSSSYAALKKNGLVSSSPFASSTAAPAPPLPSTSRTTLPSPELQQVPYEIGPLSHESAPFGYGEEVSPVLEPSSFTAPAKSSGQLGLGSRPGAPPSLNNGRLYTVTTARPPISPPRATAVSPTSALSSTRRGMRGPRAMSAGGTEDDGNETEREEAAAKAAATSRSLRRQPSNKTVTWAETEEVLEFEVEEERRRSMMSDASTVSDDERHFYGRDSSEEEEEDSFDEPYISRVGDYSFEEGGSVVEHRDEDGNNSDADDSVVSTASSAMDDMIGQIDSYIHEGESFSQADVFSPSQIPYSDTPDIPSHRSIPGYASPLTSPRPHQPRSAFSVSTASDEVDDAASDIFSTSCYDDDDAEPEEEQLKVAREQILARQRASLTSPLTAPGSPSRPPLPSPPMLSQQHPFQVAPAIPAAPSHLGPPAPSSAGLVKSESQYSLPDIPGTSPFLGFEDDGTADSVVTLNDAAAPTTRPLQPQSHTPAPATPTTLTGPSQSTPTSAVSARSSIADSPILSALNRPDLSPALSRKASLVGSDVSGAASSISWYGSTANGSLRGASVRLTGDRMAERRKNHQALLGLGDMSSPSSSPIAAFGAFPSSANTAAFATSTPPPAASSSAAATAAQAGPFSFAMDVKAQSAPTDSLSSSRPTTTTGSHIFAARPAPKARSATLSSSMIPTFAASPQRNHLAVSVGDALTAEVAQEMQSPLERLQLGVKGASNGGGMWRSGDSLLGVNELAEGRDGEEEEEEEEEEGELTETEDRAPMTRSASAASALEEREQAIIAKRREKAGLAPPSSKGKGRRRSRSTSDVDVAETTSHSMEFTQTMPELGFEQRVGEDGFSFGVLESLDDIYNSRNRTYRVRESKRLVVVSDINNSKAGDVDPGRAWRKKRPSNVHEINRSMSTMSIGSQQTRRTREHSGQLFVHLRDVTFDNVPMPRTRVNVTATLDNGRQRVDAAVRELGQKISLKKEFELVCSESLAFSIHFSVPPAPPPPAPAPSLAVTTPPASPTKPRSGFRIFSSPKKRAVSTPKVLAPVPPPTPDPFYDYVSPDGQLATARVTFATEAANCRLKKSRILVPFGPKASKSPRTCSGSLTVELLFVPAAPGIPKTALPKSMDEVTEGLHLAEWATKITHESVLTQMGGDCTVWRRRQVKLRGSTLVPYSEVTKRSHVEINLALVASIEDLNVQTMPTPGSNRSFQRTDEDDDVFARMDHSFRLVFKDGNKIDFFADTEESKTRWLEELNGVVGKAENKKTAPEWAVAVRKLPVPTPKAA